MRRAAVVVFAAGCVVGVRGEAVFEAEHDLADIDEVQIDLPSTPLTVLGCNAAVPDTCPPSLRYDGTWMSTGGTRSDARRNATTPSLLLQRDDRFARLRAEIPLAVEGLVELEMGEIRLPDTRDLDLRTTLGNVEVFGMQAAITVEVEIGEVEIRGGDGGVGVSVDQGFVDVQTAGHADVRTRLGSVAVTQTGGAQDLYVSVARGNISVTLAADADLDVEIRAPGTIRVQTDAINTVTSGALSRRTGNAAFQLELITDDGDVTVDLAEN